MAEVEVNGLGTNKAIKFNCDENLLRKNKFTFFRSSHSKIPPHWSYVSYFTDDSDGFETEFSFNVTYYEEPYKGANLEIITIDEDYGQPYDYQSILEKNPKQVCALQVKDFVEEEMRKLKEAGIISGHSYGEYI